MKNSLPQLLKGEKVVWTQKRETVEPYSQTKGCSLIFIVVIILMTLTVYVGNNFGTIITIIFFILAGAVAMSILFIPFMRLNEDYEKMVTIQDIVTNKRIFIEYEKQPILLRAITNIRFDDEWKTVTFLRKGHKPLEIALADYENDRLLIEEVWKKTGRVK